MGDDLARSLANEKSRLETLADNFSSEHGFNARLIDYGFETLQPFFTGVGNCLELGCADGRMTRKLVERFPNLTVVDASSKYIETMQQKFPTVNAVCSLFEEFKPTQQYDLIIMSHILEHVEDPVAVLKLAKPWLTPKGRIAVTVPHANSIHRQVGLIMGVIQSMTELSEADFRIGHRRYYTKETLLQDIASADLASYHVGGIYFKSLSNAQMEERLNQQQMDAFYELGKKYPDLCAELFVVAGLPTNA